MFSSPPSRKTKQQHLVGTRGQTSTVNPQGHSDTSTGGQTQVTPLGCGGFTAFEDTLEDFLSMLLQSTTQQKSTSVTEQQIMVTPHLRKQTLHLYMQEKRGAWRYQQQPQKKDERHARGKLCHTAHLINESSSSIFNFHLQKAGRIASMQPRAVGGLPMKRSRGQTSTVLSVC